MPLAREDFDSNLVNMEGEEAMVELKTKPQLLLRLEWPQCREEVIARDTRKYSAKEQKTQYNGGYEF